MCGEVVIGEKRIRKESKDFYLVAEVGVNYYDIASKEGISLLEAAKLMIREAALAGVDAVKFQTYKAEKLASKNSPAYWDLSQESTKTQFELFKKYDKLDYDEYKELAEECRKYKVDFLSSPFDLEAVEALYDIVAAYKIASADITNKPLIKSVARRGKPIILSTGASSISEIWQAVEWIEEEGNNQIALLHCILSYPAKREKANLGMIRHMNRVFKDYVIGFSDHIPPEGELDVLVTAFLLGANIIEKHFTLDKSLPGNDHYHAMDASDVKKLVSRIEELLKIYGEEHKKVVDVEEDSRRYARRSIVASRNIKAGEEIKADMITVKRPGTGISPVFWNDVIGSKAKRDICEDEILTWDMILKDVS